jgi:hypothetical protein
MVDLSFWAKWIQLPVGNWPKTNVIGASIDIPAPKICPWSVHTWNIVATWTSAKTNLDAIKPGLYPQAQGEHDMPDTIGGPKITGSNGGTNPITLQAGTQQNIQIYNDTSQQRDWKIALPMQLPAWLILTPSNGTLAANGATQTITVRVAGGTNPTQVSVTFGWNPSFDQPTDDTLVVTVTQ